MGRLHEPVNGNQLHGRMKMFLRNMSDLEYFQKPRIGLILGTGWSNPDVLKDEGFVCEKTIEFHLLGIGVKNGSGHPNTFLFGTWHGKDIVISQGRLHLFQDQKYGHDSLIRQWMTWLISFMNGSKQLVMTSAVGGLSGSMKEDMLVMPTAIVSAHLPMPYLIGSDGEFVMSEHLLWEDGFPEQKFDCNTQGKSKVFFEALQSIEKFPATEHFKQLSSFVFDVHKVKHYVVPGPGFGGATERKLWVSWGMNTVGMSLDPELRLVALENLDNRPKGVNGAYHETDIRVFPTLFVSDAHDLPNNDEIQARAKAMAPKLGKFLSCVVESEW